MKPLCASGSILFLVAAACSAPPSPSPATTTSGASVTGKTGGPVLVYQKIKLGIDEGKFNGKVNLREDCRVALGEKTLTRATNRELTFDFLDPARPEDFVSAHLGFTLDGKVLGEVTSAQPNAPKVVVHADDVKNLSIVGGRTVDAAYLDELARDVGIVTDETAVTPITDPPELGVPDLVAASPYVTYWKVVTADGKESLIERNIVVSAEARARLHARFPDLQFFVDAAGAPELKTLATNKLGDTPPALLAAINGLDDVGSHGCAAK